MGMSMMGMMGMVGMMGSGKRNTPPAEKPPDLKREEHIQLGTNFVNRIEVRRQPLAQIRAYLERQMGLSESESNEVLRRSGIDPTAGREERLGGRDAYLASRESGARKSSRARSSDGDEQSGMGDPAQPLQPGQIPVSLAYAAAAAALAPPQSSWRSWLFGPSAEEATLKAYHSYQQQLLQQAYSSAGQYTPSTLVLQGADAGTVAMMGTGRWMSRRFMLVLMVGFWLLARAGLARWLLDRLAASCGELATLTRMHAHARQTYTEYQQSVRSICSRQRTVCWVCTIRACVDGTQRSAFKEKQEEKETGDQWCNGSHRGIGCRRRRCHFAKHNRIASRTD